MKSGITWFACPLFSILVKGINLPSTDPQILFSLSIMWSYNNAFRWSFFFQIVDRLPGRALANKQPIWLCNAQYADSKVFSRSLLAKVGFLVNFYFAFKANFN